MPRAVIFDVDGTFVDSNELHARAWQDALRRSGFHVPLAAIRPQIGKGGDTLLPALLSPADDKKFHDTISGDRDRIFQRDYLQQVKPFHAVRELVERCRAAGLKVVLASSGKTPEVRHHVELAGVEDLLDGRTSSDDADRSKPHPDIFEAALKDLGRPRPGDVVVVGDTPYDAEAAGKVGLRTIGMLCGGFPDAELRRAGCVAVYRDPTDLLANFNQSVLAEPRRGPGLGEFAYWLAVTAAVGGAGVGGAADPGSGRTAGVSARRAPTWGAPTGRNLQR